MDSDLEFADLVHRGRFREEKTCAYIFLRVNEIVNRFLGALKDPVELETDDAVYLARNQVDSATTVRTEAELDLLQAVRSGKFDRIEVKVKKGQIRFIDTGGDVDSGDVEEAGESVRVKRKSGFETFSVTTRDGRLVKVRRQLPKKYSEAENEAVLFVGRVGRGSEDPSEGEEE